MSILILFACEKKEIKPDCEINNTFTLNYRNFRGSQVKLVIDNTTFMIQPKEEKIFTVSTKSLGNIYVIQKIDSMYRELVIDTVIQGDFVYGNGQYITHNVSNTRVVSRMIGKPNCCATYNYWW